MTADPAGKFLYVANQNDNTVSVYTINGDGTLASAGTVTAGNEPESVAVDPTGKFAYVANLANATISMFTVNPSTGALTPNSPATIATSSQPLVVAMAPSGKFIYCSEPENNMLSIYSVNSNGTLTAAGTMAVNNPESIALTGATQ